MPIIRSLYRGFRAKFSDRYPRFYEMCEQRKSIIKFFLAGCVSGGVDLILLYIFHGLWKMDIVLSTSSAFVLSFLISFTLQKFWTFRNYCQDKVVHQLFLYVLNAFIALYFNGLFMHILVNKYRIWYILAQIAVNLMIAGFNFIIYKFLIFRIGKNETNRQQEAIGRRAGDVA